MLQKLKYGIVALGLLLIPAVAVVPAAALSSFNARLPAQVADAKSDACAGLDEINGGSGCGSKNGVTSLVSTIVNILSWVIGVAAVIMVVASGFRFITSGGESSKVAGAKNALVYALVGLVVAALAQVLVHFVLNTANSSTPCPSNHKILSGNAKCK